MVLGIHTLEFEDRADVGAGAVALRFRPRHTVGYRAAHPRATYLVAGTSAFAKSTTAAPADHGIDRRQVRRDAFHGWSGPRT